MWNRPNVECLQSQDLPWARVPDGELGAGGGVRKTLSVDAGAGAATALVRFRAPQRGVLLAGGDLHIVAGEGVVNGHPYGPGHYLAIPPRAPLDLVPAGGPTTALVGAFGPASLVDDDAGAEPLTHVAVEDLPWSRPDGAGAQAADGAVKWLRRDDRGIAFLSAKLPGWRSWREERHPHAEESFRLSGDFLVGSRGVLTAGGYFFHRPGRWHGPLYTRTGTAAIIRADAPIETEHRAPTVTIDLGRSYLPLPHPALT